MTPEELNAKIAETEITEPKSPFGEIRRVAIFPHLVARIRELEAELAAERARPRPTFGVGDTIWFLENNQPECMIISSILIGRDFDRNDVAMVYAAGRLDWTVDGWRISDDMWCLAEFARATREEVEAEIIPSVEVDSNG